MTKCTDPQQWAAVPGSDAPEEDVARYLTHLEECAFHAAIEQCETAQLGAVLAFGESEPGGRNPESGGRAAAAMLDGLDLLGAIRRDAFIRALSIRVDGSERCRLDLTEASAVTLEVEEGSLVGVWQPDYAGEADDLYLTTYVLHPDGTALGAKRISSTVLEGGQRISFTVELGGGSRCRLTVMYAETRWPRAARLSLTRLRRRLAARASDARRISSFKLATGLLALLAALSLPAFFLLRAGRPTERAMQEDASRPAAAPAIAEPAAAPPTSAPPAPNVNVEAQSAPTRNTIPAPSARPRMSLAKVRRVYVGAGEGEYLQRLRAAVIAQLRASGRFTVVARRQEADAVLLSELTRGAGVRVQLLDRDGKALWFTTQPASGEGVEDVSEAAAGIVGKLSDKAQQRPPRAAPRRR
jgi:hypothetical protein